MMMIKKNILGLLLFLALPLQASEDNLLLLDDTFSTQAEQAAPSQNNQPYRIPFKRYHSGLESAGRNILMGLLPKLRNAEKIIVQGRPDKSVNGNLTEKMLQVAQRRGNSIKQELVKSGIPASRIFVEQLSETLPAEIPDFFNATIKVANSAAAGNTALTESEAVVPLASASKFSSAASREAIPANSVRKVLKTAADNRLSAMETGKLFESWIAVESPASLARRNTSQNDVLVPVASVRRVLRVAIENNLGADDASRMFESWLAVELAPGQAKRVAPYTVYASNGQTYGDQAYNRPQWRLEPGKNLRDNIADWARQANWGTPVWQASSNYKIVNAVSFDGELSDALRQVSDQAKLNICVTHAQRSIKITDSNVSCKD